MKNIILFAAFLLISLGIVAVLSDGVNIDYPRPAENSASESAEISENGKPKKTLKSFGSQQELDSFLKNLVAKRRDLQAKSASKSDSNSMAGNTATVTGADKQESKQEESVTNVQHAGVDEGGIVKLHGDYLIILRRGRLFTVAIGDDRLRPISTVDAFAPDINPDGTWYDEMLVSGSTIAVIGYSYQRGGTEIGLFNIDGRGALRYRSTYHLRSNDYYSSRNYASRLVGGKLVFYTPQYLWLNSENPTAEFPALRRWRKGATNKDFQPITAPTRVYRPARDISGNYGVAALHTVTVCSLDSSDFDCEATAVIGPAGRVFYVSPTSVYVWVTDWWSDPSRARGENRSTLYQMPLDGSAPSALGVSGSPVDQFSFLESDDNYLNVLVRSEAAGDGMWKAEATAGDVALLRVPRDDFSDGSENAAAARYRELPKPAEGYVFQNRFVGDYLLYGTGNSWDYPKKKSRYNLYAARWKTGEANDLPLEHSVDRIEPMGKDAVVVGANGKNLYFSPVRLDDDSARIRSSYIRRNAAQGELRSHGFFYKAEDSDSGLLGLPIRGGGRAGYESLYDTSASILFLRNESLSFREMGALKSARQTRQQNDKCRASCVDWYGNARPLFVRGRVFALLGYELVEGEVTTDGISEKRRVNFSPA